MRTPTPADFEPCQNRERCERAGWMETAARHLGNEEYYRGLVEQIGDMLGEQAYIADDGVKHDRVLCAKVPELVRAALTAAGEDENA